MAAHSFSKGSGPPKTQAPQNIGPPAGETASEAIHCPENFTHLLESMGESHFETDLSGKLTCFNDYVCRFHGRSREELMQLDYRSFMQPDEAKKVFRIYTEVFRSGHPSELFEYDIIRKDGSTASAQGAVSLRRGTHGEPIGFHGIVRDITEKKKMERAIRQSEEKHRSIIANIEEGYYEVDLKGNFTFVNAATARNLGWNQDELIGMNYKQYMPARSSSEAFRVYNEVFRTGIPVKTFQCEIFRKDGAPRIHEMSISPLRWPSGEIFGFFGISRDLTERLQIERALRESEESYRSIMDLSPDTITINRVGDGCYVQVNRAFCLKTGYTQEEVIGRTPLELNLFVDVDGHKQLTRELRKGIVAGLELQFRAKDGTIFDDLVSGRPIHFQGQACYLLVATIITPLKQAQQALRESEESYRRVIELAPDAITVTRLDDGKYFEVNEIFCQQTGYSREEVLGKTVTDLNLYANPDDRRRFTDFLRKADRVVGMEICFRSKTGAPLINLVSARIMQFKGEQCILVVATLINALKAAQEANIENEARFRNILEAAPDAICLTRLSDGKYIELNPAFYRITGFSREEAIGRSSLDLNLYVNPGDRERFIDLLHRQGHVDGFEMPVRYKDGRISINLWGGRIIQYRGEACLLVVAKEIDELKHTQKALEEREEGYRTILDTAPYSITLMRLSDTTYVQVNNAFCRNSGYTKEEAIGRTARQLHLFVEDKEHDRFSDAFRLHGQIDAMEVRFRRKDGQVTDTLVSARTMRYKGEVCLLAIIMDLAPLKKAEERLRESEASHRRILESAPYPIVITRLSDACYLQVNDAFCQRTGFSREETIGRTNRALKIYADPADRKRLVDTFQRQGRVEGMEIRFRTKDGHFHESLVSVNPIRYKGDDCLLTMTVDISERKRAEKELEQYRRHLEEMVRARTMELEAAQNELIKREKLSVLGQLTATVSHELRNPLGVIRSSNFYLQRRVKGKDEKIDKHFKRIEEQVTLCDAIVADLLEFTRGRSVCIAKEDLGPWLEALVNQLREDEDVEIALYPDKSMPAVPHDREKLRRAVLNLLDNAVQAVRTRQRTGGSQSDLAYAPRIVLRTYIENGNAVIEITDNGIGMNNETLERAFEPLFTTRARGTGIGLANVKKIVEEHGGSVVLESRIGEGTRMAIRLPCW